MFEDIEVVAHDGVPIANQSGILTETKNSGIIVCPLGGDSDSTTVTNPDVHAVMTANHVNPKLLTISCQRRQLRSGGINPASGL